MVFIRDLIAGNDEIGDMAAQEILQSLVPFIDKHTGVTSISSRYSRHEILSVLPHTDGKRVKTLIEELGMDLKNREMLKMQSYGKVPLSFSICAGVAYGKPGTELGTLVEQAKSEPVVLAEVTYHP